MAKPSDFSATLMAQFAQACAKAGVEPVHIDQLCRRQDLIRAIPQLILNQAQVVVKSILTLLGTITVPTQSKFVVHDHFKLDTSKNAVVKIGYIWNEFTAWFNDLVEGETPEQELKYHKLEEDSLDERILQELGDKAETKLSQLFALLKKQPNGEDGALLTNGYTNIFYVHDASGELRVVGVLWNAGFGYWIVRAYELGDSRVWRAGARVFSQQTL